MGLGSQGKKVMHAIVGSSQFDVACIAKGVATDRGVEKPTVVADCSNMACTCKTSASIALSLVNHFVKWVDSGLVVTPACDGPSPHSKQAHNQRIADCEKRRIKSCT